MVGTGLLYSWKKIHGFFTIEPYFKRAYVRLQLILEVTLEITLKDIFKLSYRDERL